MSLLSWNCRGLEQPRTVRELICLVYIFCPKLVFLSETRQQKDRVRNLRTRVGLNNCFVVDGEGKGGGLTLYWDDSIKIDIISFGRHHIGTLIWDGERHAAWRGTFVYGEPRTQDRYKM
jgi:hypothetical protein